VAVAAAGADELQHHVSNTTRTETIRYELI
jgi:hypothetical protein